MANKNYEGMFLVDAGNPDFEAASQPIRTILARYEARILSMKPWDERRLAYEIQGRKRGLYILTYFSVDPLKLAEIEHDCLLDEAILRSLMLRIDNLTEETINAQTPATGLRPPEIESGEDSREGREYRRRDDAPDHSSM